MRYVNVIDGVVTNITEFKGRMPAGWDAENTWVAHKEAQIGWKETNGTLAPLPPPEPTKKELIEAIRVQRDGLLKASDWTQLADAPVDREAWAEYRQKLRDLPGSTEDPSNPAWPEEPK